MKVFKLEQSHLAYRADFAAYGLAIVSIAAALLITEPAAHWPRAMLLCLAGLASWTLIEYLLHRFVLHSLQPFARWHAMHHERPTALICTPTVLSAGLILVLFCLPAALLFGWTDACALTLGLTIGYFAYAVLHHALHHWKLDSAWLRRRKIAHAVHHHAAAGICFGVTTGVWDTLFRTAPRGASRAGRAASSSIG